MGFPNKKTQNKANIVVIFAISEVIRRKIVKQKYPSALAFTSKEGRFEVYCGSAQCYNSKNNLYGNGRRYQEKRLNQRTTMLPLERSYNETV